MGLIDNSSGKKKRVVFLWDIQDKIVNLHKPNETLEKYEVQITPTIASARFPKSGCHLKETYQRECKKEFFRYVKRWNPKRDFVFF